MGELIIKDVKKIVIDKYGIIIYQNNKVVIKLDKSQILNIGNYCL